MVKLKWVGGLLLLFLWVMPAHAQEPATPIPVNPPTGTPTPPPPTDVPTRTPTSLGPASVEALQAGTNVRAQPDIGAELVKQIGPGQTYPVLGKYFEWYQIQFPESRTGFAWVHQSVVQVIGDVGLIPEIDPAALPTQDPALLNAQATAAILTLTPGGALTITANAILNPTLGSPVAGATSDAPQVVGNGVLPTYTFPAQTSTPLNLAEIGSQRTVSVGGGGMPPIIPILGFLGVGGAGLLLSVLRRL